MKESGINYFYSGPLALDSGAFAVMYVYEEGAGINVASVSGGQAEYNGTLSSSTTFWSKPGSGFYSGATLTVNDASGAHSESWTKIFVYEQTRTGALTLFDSLNGTSGCRIGITDSNRLYFESYNQQPVVAAAFNNLSSKNAVAVSYGTNYVNLNYFNVNAQVIESEEFNYNFQTTRSDRWQLGGGAPYYADYFIHLTEFQSPEVIGQLLSGLYARPTGYSYVITTICSTGITGYQDIIVGEVGVTGYSITPGGDEGRDYYTGAFPTFHTTTELTGYLSSGLYSSGVAGIVCTDTTGAATALLEYQTGYAASFGMRKIQLFTPLISTDIVKAGYSYVPFSDIYNEDTQPQYSGYLMLAQYPSGLLNVYYNGIAQGGSGWVLSGSYLFVTGSQIGDIMTLDLKYGDKKSYPVNSGQTSFIFPYSGQEIYLNGVNLISGYDYTVTGNLLALTSRNTGIDGDIFEIPIVLTSTTGRFTVQIGAPFWRDTSNVYLNGVRQDEDVLYVEGGAYDLLSGQFFDYSDVASIYDNTDLYWET
jgi:hypothetical protein